MAAEKYLIINSLSLVFLATTFTILYAGGHAAAQSQGSDICQKADYVALCRSVLKDVSDPFEATKVAIEHLIFETKRAKESSAKNGVDPQSLDTCKVNYDEAISNLQSCLENLKSHDMPTLNSNLSAALTAYVTCDDAISELGSNNANSGKGIIDTDTMLRQLAGNSLYVASLTT